MKIKNELIQGSPEWLALRKTKITATDAPVLMGASPWKTPLQLYNEKKSNENNFIRNQKMQRGLDLEPIARDLFTMKTGQKVEPKVVFHPEHDWLMASLDGINEYQNCLVEIKCPNEKDHALALSGNVPEHYYPQLQHQIMVCNVPSMYYFSFDGIDGAIVEVLRNDDYIKKLFETEKKFYDCLVNDVLPEPAENDYLERNDEEWKQCASKWQYVNSMIKELEKTEQKLKEELIFLSGKSNSRGAGIRLCQISRKGNVDYSKIECLNHIDLEKYRKPSSNSWRISLE